MAFVHISAHTTKINMISSVCPVQLLQQNKLAANLMPLLMLCGDPKHLASIAESGNPATTLPRSTDTVLCPLQAIMIAHIPRTTRIHS